MVTHQYDPQASTDMVNILIPDVVAEIRKF
jgi:hypothetical protein